MVLLEDDVLAFADFRDNGLAYFLIGFQRMAVRCEEPMADFQLRFASIFFSTLAASDGNVEARHGSVQCVNAATSRAGRSHFTSSLRAHRSHRRQLRSLFGDEAG